MAPYSLNFIMRVRIRRLEKTPAFLCVSTCATRVLLRLMKSQRRRKVIRAEAVHKESHGNTRNACGIPNRGRVLERRGLFDIVLVRQFRRLFILYRWPIRSVAKLRMLAELSHCMLWIRIMSLSVCIPLECINFQCAF